MRPIALHGPNATHLAFVPDDRENRADVAEEDDDDDDEEEDDEDDDEDDEDDEEEEEGDGVPVAARALIKAFARSPAKSRRDCEQFDQRGAAARGLDPPPLTGARPVNGTASALDMGGSPSEIEQRPARMLVPPSEHRIITFDHAQGEQLDSRDRELADAGLVDAAPDPLDVS